MYYDKPRFGLVDRLEEYSTYGLEVGEAYLKMLEKIVENLTDSWDGDREEGLESEPGMQITPDSGSEQFLRKGMYCLLSKVKDFTQIDAHENGLHVEIF